MAPRKTPNVGPSAGASALSTADVNAAARARGTSKAKQAARPIDPAFHNGEMSRVEPVRHRVVDLDSLPVPKPVSAFKTLLALLVFFVLLSWGTITSHYRLPLPGTADRDPTTGEPVFSERNAMDVIKHLSEDFGYRIVGTKEHMDAGQWFLGQLQKFKERVEVSEGKRPGGRRREVEIWYQEGDGAHRFDFMSAVVFKKYYSMTNLIVRLSDPSVSTSKHNAILINSHLDSTLPSPGAADDGAGVGVMFDAMRVLSEMDGPLMNSIIFLFNNGEESLQDASHLFMTQHELAGSVRAVINLEACGVSGPEILFQATSLEMIKAYSHAPHPYGTVLANDVFSSGIILSDTDFRQFVEYGGGLKGLDMAIVGDSYKYHTRLDMPQYIEPGAVQHMGENVLAILKYLVSPAASISHLGGVPANSTTGEIQFHRDEKPVYFSFLGRFFFMARKELAGRIFYTVATLAQFFFTTVIREERKRGSLKVTTLALVGVVASLLGAILGANTVAFVMAKVLSKSMSWFRYEFFCVALYGPPALVGALLPQLGLSKLLTPKEYQYLERANLSALYIIFGLVMLILHAFNIGSAYLFAISTVFLLIAVFINDIFLVGFSNCVDEEEQRKAGVPRVNLFTYFLAQAVPIAVGVECLVSFLDLFVPLTGRTGEISPVDHIVGTLTAFLGFFTIPTALALVHRFGVGFLHKAILAGTIVTTVAIAIFAGPKSEPFDAMHPKRVFMHHVENVTSDEFYLNIGAADPAPGFHDLVNDLHAHFGVSPDEPAQFVEMTPSNTDWNVLYPVSLFLTPYKFRLPSPPPSEYVFKFSSGEAFKLYSTEDKLDEQRRLRNMTLVIEHPGIIWTVIAFDADIIAWDLPMAPPTGGFQRHHIKEVSLYGHNRWTIELSLRLSEEEFEAAKAGRVGGNGRHGRLLKTNGHEEIGKGRMKVDFLGLEERGMFPGKSEEGRGLPSIETFRRVDAHMHDKYDCMMLGAIGGVVEV